jgi:hypothetical protein
LKVAEWLADRGRSFRAKDTPDNKGRTVYVLAECPFNPSHGPDSCITQEPDGKLGAQCFHYGCVGRGWRELKEAIGAPDSHHHDPPLSGNDANSPSPTSPPPDGDWAGRA